MIGRPVLAPLEFDDAPVHEQMQQQPQPVLMPNVPFLRSFAKSQFIDVDYVAHGQFGTVERARHPLLGQVAIKTLYRNDASTIHVETGHLHQVNSHPNIIRLFGKVFEEDEAVNTGLIMEYMEDGTLKALIHSQTLDYKVHHVLNWLRQIASGAEFLHHCNIIHRDIKPDNLMMGKSYSEVKMADFGLAREQGLANRQMTTNVGDIQYSAPETSSRDYGNKIDVYSLGITLYEILKRGAPYGSETNVFSIITRVRGGHRPDLEGFSDNARLFSQSLWSKDPESRPSMAEICRRAFDTLNQLKMYEADFFISQDRNGNRDLTQTIIGSFHINV